MALACVAQPNDDLGYLLEGGRPSLPPGRPTSIANLAAAPEQTVLTNRTQVSARTW